MAYATAHPKLYLRIRDYPFFIILVSKPDPMRYSIFSFSLLVCSTALFAQPEKVDYHAISKIKDEAFNHSQVMETLFNLTDVCGPRLSGSSNLKNAQQYAQKKFIEWGMSNVAVEPWGGFGRGWQVNRSYAAMTAPYYQPLIAIPKAWTPGTNGLITAEAVLVKIDHVSDFEKYRDKLKGKIIVLGTRQDIKLGLKPEAKRYTNEDLRDIFLDKSVVDNPDNRPLRDTAQLRLARILRQNISNFLVKENAAAIITSRGGSMGTFFTTNGASYGVGAKPVLPELETGGEQINQLIRLLESGTPVKLELDIQTAFTDNDTMQYNVIGEIPGTDKRLQGEVVMIGAHLDSWHAGTGATDNAAGSAVMMEVMRILHSMDAKPRRTIRVALWSAEEQGLLGSKGYVKNHFADPETMVLKPAHAKLSAYYNLDNGGGKVRGIYLQGNDAARNMFEAWLAPFTDLEATTVTSRSTGSTDHIAFDNVGLPGFQFIQDPMDYQSRTHHTNMDTYDRIQKADLMQASAVIAAVVYHTANRDEKLPRKPLPKAKATK
jgi:hypothetical protein